MKATIAVVAGIIFGVAIGYWLRGELAAPLGSNVAETRVLASDLDLDTSYFCVPNKAPVGGTIKKGSRVDVSWRKSDAAYIRFQTVVPYDRLAAVSTKVSKQ